MSREYKCIRPPTREEAVRIAFISEEDWLDSEIISGAKYTGGFLDGFGCNDLIYKIGENVCIVSVQSQSDDILDNELNEWYDECINSITTS